MKLTVNKHGVLRFESADKTISAVFSLYVTSITIGNFWFHIGRDDVYDEDSDEMFFLHLNYKQKELATIYAYLPTSLYVRVLGRKLWG